MIVEKNNDKRVVLVFKTPIKMERGPFVKRK